MSKVIVADSACLIGLSRVNQLAVLRELFGKAIIPPAVHYEVVVQGGARPGAKEVSSANWIEVVAVKDQLAVKALNLKLGLGESEAIVLAEEQAVDIIILDDWQARQTAFNLNLAVIGTLAVLSKAHEKGLIENLATVISDLQKSGFYFLGPL